MPWRGWNHRRNASSSELKKDDMITISVADTGLGIVALERGAGSPARRQSDIGGGTLIRMALAARECELNGQTRKGCNDMRTRWCVIFAASAMMATIDGLHAQPEENPGRNEFLRSCASCHGVSGKGDGPVAKSLRPRPSDLTKLSEANNGVFPVSRVHEVIDGRIERLVHGTRDMPVWGERYMREMISPESPNFVSKEWAEAMVRRRISALVEYISTLQRPTRRSR
jgi:mono/diheme cytochrome c family protein